MVKRHQAFTTLELLIALGLIMLLAGMLVVGLKTVLVPNQRVATKAQLEVARSMLSEPGALDRVKAMYGLYLTNPPMDYAAVNMLCPTGLVESNTQRLFFAQTRMGLRIPSPARIMETLYAFPGNKKIRDALPSEKVKRINQPSGITSPALPAPPEPAGSIFLVDAWGRPIIFVPPGGLAGVWFADNPAISRIVTSAGVVPAGGNIPLGTRGFFASAGPDGEFGYVDRNGNRQYDVGVDTPAGDDNLYSFEN